MFGNRGDVEPPWLRIGGVLRIYAWRIRPSHAGTAFSNCVDRCWADLVRPTICRRAVNATFKANQSQATRRPRSYHANHSEDQRSGVLNVSMGMDAVPEDVDSRMRYGK